MILHKHQHHTQLNTWWLLVVEQVLTSTVVVEVPAEF
jgi:hypothetical protein